MLTPHFISHFSKTLTYLNETYKEQTVGEVDVPYAIRLLSVLLFDGVLILLLIGHYYLQCVLTLS